MNERVPTFETKRLVLRDHRASDIPSYQRYFDNYEVIRHLSRVVPWPYPADGVETFLKTVIDPHQGINQWFWVITLKEEPEEAVGCVHLWRNRRPEHRGFWLEEKHWGKGIITEAVRPIIDYAFESLRFENLIFSNALGNVRSRRIKEKTGARFLPTEAMKFIDPAIDTRELWELQKSEWENAKP